MRLIDADALLEAAKAALKYETNPVWTYDELQDLIANSPTVQREGWVSVDELQKVYDDMFNHKDIARVAQSLWNLIHAK